MAAYVGSYLLIGWDVLKAAFLGMMRGRAINENFLMSIASLGAMFLLYACLSGMASPILAQTNKKSALISDS